MLSVLGLTNQIPESSSLVVFFCREPCADMIAMPGILQEAFYWSALALIPLAAAMETPLSYCDTTSLSYKYS